MRDRRPQRTLAELAAMVGEPTEDDLARALSARWKPEDHQRRHEQAMSAGFDRLPEPEVEPEPPPPKPEPLPAIEIDIPVRAFGIGDTPWGVWLIGGLNKEWPFFAGYNLWSVIQGWARSNDHHFIRTSNAASLAISVPHPFFGVTAVVRGIFCWSRFPQEDEAELHLVQLHRHTIDWARARRAARFELFEKNDLIPTRADFYLRPKSQRLRYVETK